MAMDVSGMWFPENAFALGWDTIWNAQQIWYHHVYGRGGNQNDVTILLKNYINTSHSLGILNKKYHSSLAAFNNKLKLYNNSNSVKSEEWGIKNKQSEQAEVYLARGSLPWHQCIGNGHCFNHKCCCYETKERFNQRPMYYLQLLIALFSLDRLFLK